MNEKAKSGPGRRGRQAGDEDSREALIAAARPEFAAHGFRGATIRQVAARAGVTPAMVHYHFKDKQGLYRAMLEATLGPLMRDLQSLAEHDEHNRLERAVGGYMRMLASNPELPALLVRDVLAGDGSMREMFIHEFAGKAAVAMRGIVQVELAESEVREDIDPRFALLSLISMAAFPFIARPIATKLLGLEYDDATVDALARHTVKMFRDGIREPGVHR